YAVLIFGTNKVSAYKAFIQNSILPQKYIFIIVVSLFEKPGGFIISGLKIIGEAGAVIQLKIIELPVKMHLSVIKSIGCSKSEMRPHVIGFCIMVLRLDISYNKLSINIGIIGVGLKGTNAVP